MKQPDAFEHLLYQLDLYSKQVATSGDVTPSAGLVAALEAVRPYVPAALTLADGWHMQYVHGFNACRNALLEGKAG